MKGKCSLGYMCSMWSDICVLFQIWCSWSIYAFGWKGLVAIRCGPLVFCHQGNIFGLAKYYIRCNDVLRWLSLTHHNPPFLGHGTRTECTSITVVGIKAFAFSLWNVFLHALSLSVWDVSGLFRLCNRKMDINYFSWVRVQSSRLI